MSGYAEGPPLPIVKVEKMIGESTKSWEDAAHEVVAEAQMTVRGISRIAMSDFDIRIQEDGSLLYRVRAEVSFRLESTSSPDYPMQDWEQKQRE